MICGILSVVAGDWIGFTPSTYLVTYKLFAHMTNAYTHTHRQTNGDAKTAYTVAEIRSTLSQIINILCTVYSRVSNTQVTLQEWVVLCSNSLYPGWHLLHVLYSSAYPLKKRRLLGAMLFMGVYMLNTVLE